MEKCIVVAGMHRSGTSLITKSLECMGVSLGDNLMPSAQHNEKGFWEDIEIVNTDDKILKLAGMDWASLNEFPIELIDSKDGILLQTEAKKIVKDRLSKNKLWGVKDPRITRLLPFWKKIFSDLKVPVNYIYVLRNPIDVANSLKARDNFDLQMSLHLWLIHAFESLKNLINENICFVSYDNFLAEPEISIHKIAEFFRLNLDQEKLFFLKNNFIDLKLRHSCSSDNDLTTHKEIPQIIKNFYSLLKNLTKNKIKKDEIKNLLTEMEIPYLKNTASTIHEFSRKGHILDIELKNVMAHHKNLISQHEKLQQYRLNLETKNQTLMEDKSELKLIIEQLKNEKYQIQQINKELNEQIESIYKSKSWKLTKPIRSLKILLNKKNLK
ncbi:MAG: sulfotransferase [Desulforegulaceae bacterium]|nr:sulfotransferase [Desulforegulaceae bacterium]